MALNKQTAISQKTNSSSLKVKKTGKIKPKKKVEERGIYDTFITKLLNRIHPNMNISPEALSTVDSIISYLFDYIATESKRLAHYSTELTITVNEIQTAVRLLLPSELARNALSKAAKALSDCGESV